MSKGKTILRDTPLILRVVCLYALLAAPWWVADIIQPTVSSATSVHVPVVMAIKQEVKDQVISGQPARVAITRLGIDLPVVDGTYDAARDTWTLLDDSVQFATMTPHPNNQGGNTFLYGHNTVAVLEPVKDITLGDVLTITATNGKVFTYSYTGDASVTPDKTDVLSAPSAKPQVTLMTCQGLFSETRRLLYFTFTGVV